MTTLFISFSLLSTSFAGETVVPQVVASQTSVVVEDSVSGVIAPIDRQASVVCTSDCTLQAAEVYLIEVPVDYVNGVIAPIDSQGVIAPIDLEALVASVGSPDDAYIVAPTLPDGVIAPIDSQGVIAPIDSQWNVWMLDAEVPLDEVIAPIDLEAAVFVIAPIDSQGVIAPIDTPVVGVIAPID